MACPRCGLVNWPNWDRTPRAECRACGEVLEAPERGQTYPVEVEREDPSFDYAASDD